VLGERHDAEPEAQPPGVAGNRGQRGGAVSAARVVRPHLVVAELLELRAQRFVTPAIGGGDPEG
jgi:hypothetical protein